MVILSGSSQRSRRGKQEAGLPTVGDWKPWRPRAKLPGGDSSPSPDSLYAWSEFTGSVWALTGHTTMDNRTVSVSPQNCVLQCVSNYSPTLSKASFVAPHSQKSGQHVLDYIPGWHCWDIVFTAHKGQCKLEDAVPAAFISLGISDQIDWENGARKQRKWTSNHCQVLFSVNKVTSILCPSKWGLWG